MRPVRSGSGRLGRRGRFDNFNLNFRNTEYYASYVMCAYKNLFDLAEKLQMNLCPLTWAFMFEGERCFEGPRSLSTQGIDKAILNLFRMFARLGTRKVEMNGGTGSEAEIGGWATCDDNVLQVMVYCYHDDWDKKNTFDVSLELKKLPMEGQVRITHYRIDREHTNVCTEWERQGKPDWPDEAQRAAILARSGLEMLKGSEKAEIKDGKLRSGLSFPCMGSRWWRSGKSYEKLPNKIINVLNCSLNIVELL